MQKALAELMSDVSEKSYCADWMMDVEYVLWHVLMNGERKYGQDMITWSDIDRLKQLSQNCNC